MNAIAVIAGREVRDGLRNRWVVAMTLLMAALALTLTLVGSAPTGTVGVSAVSATIVSLSSLTIFLVPLIALLISYDAIAGELERGTMTLLLSYPVSRSAVVAGKFVGATVILSDCDRCRIRRRRRCARVRNRRGGAWRMGGVRER